MASLLAIGASAAINALAFSGTNYLFSAFSDHGEAERRRHDLALEDLQRDRDKWNQERMERLDFINKRLRDKKEARDYIQNLDSAMLEYYRVFGVKLKTITTGTSTIRLLQGFRSAKIRRVVICNRWYSH